ELLITELRKDLERFQTQLVVKEKELAELGKKCEELKEKFSFYLELISKYKGEQTKAINMVLAMKKKGIFDEKLTNEFSQIQIEIGKLEEKIETIIEEQSLTKKDLIKDLRNEA